MMTPRINFAQAAARGARVAASELAALRQAVRSAQAVTAGLNRALHVPVVRPRRRVVARSAEGHVSVPSFYRSAAQAASSLVRDLAVGQRIL